MDKYELLNRLNAILHDLSMNGSLVSSDVVGIIQDLGGDSSVVYRISDVTVWMTYMNTLAIRYLLQEN